MTDDIKDSDRTHRLRLVDQFGGATRALALAGDVLLAGVGWRVVSLRISPQSRPTLVGQSPPLKGIVERIVLAGSRAYVGDEYSIHILDVGVPEQPTLLGEVAQEYALGEYLGYDCSFAGTEEYLYVLGDFDRLLIFDVKDPARPRYTGRYVEPSRRRRGSVDVELRGLRLVGPLGYAPTSSGLAVFDFGEPERPALLGSCSVGDAGTCVAVAGHHAYLGTEAGLHRIDVSDPTCPEPAGFFGSASAIWAVDIAGPTAYAIAGGTGVYTIDISDPKRLAATGHRNDLYFGQDIVVKDGRAYVADDSGGLSLFDVSDPARTRSIGCDITVPEVADVGVVGQYAAVVDSRGYLLQGPGTIHVAEGAFLPGKVGGLRTVDLAASLAPSLLGWVGLGGKGRSVTLAGSMAYVAASHEVCLVDLTDVANPRRVGPIRSLEPSDKIVLDGKRLYAVEGEWLSIVALPKNPAARKLARHHLGGDIHDLAVSGGFVYVALASGLQIFDLRYPRHPKQAGLYPAREGVDSLAVVGSLAYLCVHDRLCIVDVADPARPTLVGGVRTGCCGRFRQVIVEGSLAYVIARDNLSVVDITNPVHPIELASERLDDREDEPARAILAGNRLCVACGNNGLLVYQMEEAQPAPLSLGTQ